MNLFYYLNKILLFYGLESDNKRRCIQTSMTIISISMLTLNLILVNFLYESSDGMLEYSWKIKSIVSLISFLIFRIKHKSLYKLIINLSETLEEKCIKKLSIFLVLIWLICTFTLMSSFIYLAINAPTNYVPKNFKNIPKYVLIIVGIISEISASVYVFGSCLTQILIYIHTNYIICCMRRKHYRNLQLNSFGQNLKALRRLRTDEIEMQYIVEELNNLIGFIPIIWLAEMFIRTCIIITVMAIRPKEIESSAFQSVDIYMTYSLLVTTIIIVGRFDAEYDINRITQIVNKCFATTKSIDQNFNIEMIGYIQEASNRWSNRPKACGIFQINSNLVLAFVNSVTTFSVMFIQLKAY
jgi:hypothetical protein